MLDLEGNPAEFEGVLGDMVLFKGMMYLVFYGLNFRYSVAREKNGSYMITWVLQLPGQCMDDLCCVVSYMVDISYYLH